MPRLIVKSSKWIEQGEDWEEGKKQLTEANKVDLFQYACLLCQQGIKVEVSPKEKAWSFGNENSLNKANLDAV